MRKIASRALTYLRRHTGDTGTDNQRNRDEWVARKLSKIPSGSRILDAGAGTQRYRHLCQHLMYVAQDFAKYDGSGDGSGLQAGEFNYGLLDIKSDITAIPEASESFDVILCTEVLEHLPDPGEAIREFARLLKPEGVLIITAPFCSLTHFSPFHFCSGFNTYYYEHHLARHKFGINEIDRNGNYFAFLAQELRRLPIVAGTYRAGMLGMVEKLATILVLRALNRLETRDKGSSELLCYGIHVLAVKQPNDRAYQE